MASRPPANAPHRDMHKPVTSLSPLPNDLRRGLIVLASVGALSFVACITLFLLLTWRMFQWVRRGKAPNQFVILIYNLVLADIQQSVAFLLNLEWLAGNAITVGTKTCWAQAWFLSIGDVASGAFCFLIGLHTFASIVFNYRLGNVAFGFTILGVWGLLYLLPIIGVAMHPDDIFVRATSWCWMNANYPDLRIWLHYFWIFFFEFGTVLIYLALYAAMKCRIKSDFYSESSQAQQARTAMKLMMVYPIVYVICTLPLATMRMASMNSVKITSYAWFCFAGAMITSNGWLDVLLYSLTRRIMLFSDEPPEDEYGIETFSIPFSGYNMRTFGNKTTCEYSGKEPPPKSRFASGWSKKPDAENQRSAITSYASTSQLFQPMTPSTAAFGPPSSKNSDKGISVRTKTIVQVTSEPIVELTDLRDTRAFREKDFSARSASDKSEMELEFATKPPGWP